MRTQANLWSRQSFNSPLKPVNRGGADAALNFISVLFFVICVGSIFCGAVSARAQSSVSKDPPSTSAKSNNSANEKTILFIGDSLTAGYGVRKDEAYPVLVERHLKEKGHAVKVINGGISGSVSAESDRRLNWFLKSKPDILFLALGANDGLKGTRADVVKKNLAATIDLAKKNDIKIILAGIRIFTNFGQQYTREFEGLYQELAKEKKVHFMPFLLEDVALKKELNLPDGKHPNAKGHEVLAENVVKELEKLL